MLCLVWGKIQGKKNIELTNKMKENRKNRYKVNNFFYSVLSLLH